MERRWRSFKKIALRMFIAAVACTLFALGILGATHQEQLWKQTIGPEVSGIIRASIGALDEIYETPETRPF